MIFYASVRASWEAHRTTYWSVGSGLYARLGDDAETEVEDMSSSFSFNDREIERLMNEQVNEVAHEYEQALTELALDLKGRPVEDVKLLVHARFQDLGGEITDPELTDIATAISKGSKITLNIHKED
jgi:hypothetical protein